MRSTHSLFPNNIFQLSNIETLEKKKREEKESSNYVRNDFVSRNLIRIVHIEIEGFFESVARSFQSLHRGSVGRFDERQEFCGVQRGGL